MAHDGFIRYLLLPELRLLETRKGASGGTEFFVEKTSAMEVCPRCATPSESTYDHRWVRIKDDPLRGGEAILWVHKRRFSCKPCKRPFTEPVDGVRKGYRTTQRYRGRLLWACDHFSDLKAVRSVYRCSSGLLHRVLYEQLELKRRTRLYPWPTKVAVLKASLEHIPGRENVRWVALDLSDGYRKFAREFFPNAQLVADKFHVLRLVQPAIYRYIKLMQLGRDALPLYKLLRRNPLKLSPELRWRVRTWLADKPALRELWAVKEALNRVYRVRGRDRAKRALAALTDSMAFSTLPEVRTLRRTLMYWRKEILAYFYCRLTNARTEGFNGKAKLVIRRAYGYKSFRNYRLRLLNSCA